MSSQLKYENVQFDEPDDSSTTEVESLVGDQQEKFNQLYTRKPKKNACLAVLKGLRWAVEIGLLLGIFGLLLRDQTKKAFPRTSEHEVGGDMTGVGPHCRLYKKESMFKFN
jgi:hypothetical protein